MAYSNRARRVWDDAEPIKYGQMTSSPAPIAQPSPEAGRAAHAGRGGTFDPYTSYYAGTPHAVVTPEFTRGGPVSSSTEMMLPSEQTASANKEQCAIGDVACLERNMMRSMSGPYSSFGGPQSGVHVGGNPGGFRVT